MSHPVAAGAEFLVDAIGVAIADGAQDVVCKGAGKGGINLFQVGLLFIMQLFSLLPTAPISGIPVTSQRRGGYNCVTKQTAVITREAVQNPAPRAME